MEYVNLGNTGLKASRLCLGMMTYGDPGWRDWILSEEDGRPFVKRAVEAGINFFDTANMYSRGVSEEVTGRLLKEFTRREETVVATKVFFSWNDAPNRGGLSRKHIMDAIDASLQRLGMDYVDLYQIHRFDYNTPIEETLEALHDIVKAGKARYIGASSMHTWQFVKALYLADKHGWTRFVSMQNHYNLVYREEEREMNPFCRDQNIAITPWSPLARGFLAGNRTRDTHAPTARSRNDDYAKNMYYQDADFDIVDVVLEIANEKDVSPAQIALAWLLQQPGVTSPLIGASKMPHLDQAVAALDIELSADECERLEAPYVPHKVLGHT